MPLVVGIDEAGYGPTLGPLTVGATLWNVAPRHVKSDYWELLGDCVRRAGRAGQWQLAVNDSKTVYKRKQGLSSLERPVLAFAQSAGMNLATQATLLAELGAPVWGYSGLPWYRNLDLPLPLDRARSKYEAVSERLRRTMTTAGVCCRGLLAKVVPADRFNHRVSQTRNKAAVLIEQILCLINESAAQAGDQDVVLRIDRLGGRSDYRSLLADAFPGRHLHILEVSDSHSRYRLAGPDNDWFIEFAVDADKHHLPVALASMLAKYLRESLMLRFNAYWYEKLPDLKPTAGYYTDAQRFLADLDRLSAPADPPRAQFVRAR